MSYNFIEIIIVGEIHVLGPRIEGLTESGARPSLMGDLPGEVAKGEFLMIGIAHSGSEFLA